MLQLLYPILASQLTSNLAIFGLRIFGGFSMALHGYPKLFGSKRAQIREMIRKGGIPGLLFDFVGILEFVGGVFLVFGLLTTLASGLLALEMIGTTLLHVIKMRKPPVNSKFIGGYEVDVLFLAIYLAIFLLGPGAFSVDYFL
jgi:putative oxidoreductase